MGYEVSVTPLQLATAYGALANGGVLMEPRLIRSVRDADGTVEEREPRAVRRVVSEETAEALAKVLKDVVEDGTGKRLRMETFAVAGKSGTSQIAGPNGRYLPGQYNSSFVGFFPADDPQLVVLVKLVGAEGSYYGGTIAAPVTRETLEAILAARRSPLDLRAVARSVRAAAPAPTEGLGFRFASLAGVARSADEPGRAVQETPILLGDGGEVVVPVPDLTGYSVRGAVRRLHVVGLRVDLVGLGDVDRTVPPAGARLAAGDTVVLHMSTSTKGSRRE